MKKVFSVIIIIVFAVTVVPFFTEKANAATEKDAINWMNSQKNNGQTPIANPGGANRGECVALVNKYMREVIGVPDTTGKLFYAKDMFDKNWTGFTKIAGNNNYKIGDIVVMKPYTASGIRWVGSTGHVAIVYSTNPVRLLEQNYNGRKYPHINDLGQRKAAVRGVLRPTFTGGGSGKKQVSVNKGYYILQFAGNAKHLDVAATSKNNGANIQIWDPYDSGAQVFSIGRNGANTGYYIQNIISGKFVDTAGNVTGSGHNVIQWQGNGADGQQWIFEDAGGGYVYIRNLYGYYLDVVNGVNANGTNVRVWEYNGSNAQKWKLVRVSGKPIRKDAGNYNILFAAGSRFVDVNSGSKEDGANIKIFHPNGGAAQIFKMARNSANSGYYFQSVNSGKFLDTRTNKPGRQNAIQWKGNGAFGQQWVLEDAGGGNVYIRNLYGYYLDVSGGKDEDNRNVQVWEYNGSNAQKFKLVKVSGKAKSMSLITPGEYRIKSAVGDVFLDRDGNNLVINREGTSSQIFNLESFVQMLIGGGYVDGYHFANKESGKLMDTSKSKTTGNAMLGEFTGNKTQDWFIEDAGNGYVYIRNWWGYYLDVPDGKTADGTNVNVWNFIGDKTQKWKFIDTTDYSYECTSHSWDKGVITKAATTSETGVKTYTCTVCNETKTESIPKLVPATSKPTAVSEQTVNDVKVDKSIIKIAATKIKTIGSTSKKQMTIEIPKVANASNYLVAYKTADAKFWKYYYTGGNNKYIIRGLKLKSTVQFKVAVYKGDARGDWSKIRYRYMMTAKGAKLKAGNGSIRVTWKKDSKATGYKLLYSTNKNMKGYKTITLKGSSKTKGVIKGLKKGKRYYVRVRPVKKYNGKSYVGILSAIGTVKVK